MTGKRIEAGIAPGDGETVSNGEMDAIMGGPVEEPGRRSSGRNASFGTECDYDGPEILDARRD